MRFRACSCAREVANFTYRVAFRRQLNPSLRPLLRIIMNAKYLVIARCAIGCLNYRLTLQRWVLARSHHPLEYRFYRLQTYRTLQRRALIVFPHSPIHSTTHQIIPFGTHLTTVGPRTLSSRCRRLRVRTSVVDVVGVAALASLLAIVS